jgi:hypothetical protein
VSNSARSTFPGRFSANAFSAATSTACYSSSVQATKRRTKDRLTNSVSFRIWTAMMLYIGRL